MWNEIDTTRLYEKFISFYTADSGRNTWSISSGISVENGIGIGASVNYHLGDLNIFTKTVRDKKDSPCSRFFWMISGTGPLEGYWEEFSWDHGISENSYGFEGFHQALSDMFSYIQMKRENIA